jgi:cytochrome c-type biogenesis protein CcmH
MTWVLVALLGATAFALAAFALRAPRPTWELLGSALMLGLAGYALQGSPRQPGAPKVAAEKLAGDPAALVTARRQLAGDGPVAGDRWVMIGDALARNGQYADAAGMLLGATEHDPNNGEAWLALANALVAHAEGALTPAALYAYNRAAKATPEAPGPPFFLGLALAQSGKLEQGRALWAQLLARAPANAPWRADLISRLARLDLYIAAQRGGPAAP